MDQMYILSKNIKAKRKAKQSTEAVTIIVAMICQRKSQSFCCLQEPELWVTSAQAKVKMAITLSFVGEPFGCGLVLAVVCMKI